LVNRLVFENLKHRPVRTLLSAILIGVQVVMILTLVGVSDGLLGDIANRSRGTGADIVIRPPGSSVLAFSGAPLLEGMVKVVREVPHVALASGVMMQSIGDFQSIAGIHLDEFNAMSGGFNYISGGPFKEPGDLIVDQMFADQKHVKVGSTVNLGTEWRISGIVEAGKLSHLFADLRYLQERYSETGHISVVYVKVDDPANIERVQDELQKKFDGYPILTMAQLVSLVSVDSIPLVKNFTHVVIGLNVVFGFLVVFLSMYTAVLERTREIGILKALGASPGYILGMLMRETTLLAVVGSIAGILMSYGTRWLMHIFVTTWPMLTVPLWWPIAGAIALIGSLLGAVYPGLKAARQDAIEALSYD
jgi:putative ABC transport system permease protein